MKKRFFCLLLALIMISIFSATSAFAGPAYSGQFEKSTPTLTGSTDNAGGVNTHEKNSQSSTASTGSSRRAASSELESLYDEFHKFWYVRDSYDLQDRFEEFLKSKHVDPKDIDGYDDFMETWVDHYDEDLDFDEIYDVYDLGPDDIDDPDEYVVLLDDDVDDLYDDYLDDYIDEEYYEDYGEYFDEVYYD